MMQKELETAIAIARLAGKTILEHYATDFETHQKLGADNHYEPVTIADREASRIIVEGLEAAFPDDAILSEEEVDDIEKRLARRRVWIVDPIDGTAGFVKKDGDFGVQIGLAEDGIPVLGVVFLPFYDAMSYAMKGGGSFTQTGGETPVRVTASARDDLTSMTIAVSRNHLPARMNRIIEHFGFADVVRRGSVGLKVGLIADRTCDVYIHPSPRTKLWDTCAPQIILEEAGGSFTDLFGFPFRYDRAELQNLNGILATNGAVHRQAVERLAPLLHEFGRVRV
ncbi:MAG TPA: 3'(2'),5'-bisphosphate nucleotidase CysQ [Pyrinomonadaceae bacterium]|nr:3'(2'),5'-bisphosphate nucleotidase CysQ [Chloracidobacterium sp.]MBP9934754.1 3'(2'),5'-bisphosphate nucleotidase CysQ [Pyrinomonadaceae bacterium]MBK9438140.1 3'(2'),5'-bisphosphate nucleotidase CysQ [Chloracidobacterium sp.]MBK9767539.1 3'(2'),5'-bisphosphate nucleotidase CysQ [Chloracidobacterium sp.]MBL0240986.1 3'(2'),5'-bisphosphate nucleotidase CysQ [Chloracidobacterium sp.]